MLSKINSFESNTNMYAGFVQMDDQKVFDIHISLALISLRRLSADLSFHILFVSSINNLQNKKSVEGGELTVKALSQNRVR